MINGVAAHGDPVDPPGPLTGRPVRPAQRASSPPSPPQATPLREPTESEERTGMVPPRWMCSVSGPVMPGPGPVQPNPARVYDYWLGGKEHFGCDRHAGDAVARIAPWAPAGAKACREYLRSSVRWLAAHGADQYLDIGSGLPSAGNVHQVAQTIVPAARVVYVDHDPVVLAHARALVASDPGVAVVEGDARDPAVVLDAVRAGESLDLSRPVVLLLSAILHFIGDHEDPAGIIATFCDALAPGSHLMLSHVVADDDAPGHITRTAIEQYAATTHPFYARTTSEITALFDGFDLIPPGVQQLTMNGSTVSVLAGTAIKPHPRRDSG